jgi:hypothetical protein
MTKRLALEEGILQEWVAEDRSQRLWK